MNKRTHLPIISVAAFLLILCVSVLTVQGREVSGDGPAVFSDVSSGADVQGLLQAVDPNGIQRLLDDAGGAQVSVASATGTVRFVRLTTAQAQKLSVKLGAHASVQEQAAAFFNEYGSIFGIRDAQAELELSKEWTDNLGATHLTYDQFYQGVPVFAGVVRLHFNADNLMTAVNGTFVPDIALSATPRLSADEAATIAVDIVNGTDLTAIAGVASTNVPAGAVNNSLYVFRAGLARGIPGSNHLVYEVEVSNGLNVREFVYVDAHSGKIVDQITGIHEALTRMIYYQTFGPGSLVWQEGDPLPFGGTVVITDPAVITDVNRLIDYAEDTYDLMANVTGGTFLSFDGADGTMHSVAASPFGGNCPNASWNGLYTQYCLGVSGDDTVAHEWGHAYTDYTHNLIYQWQPGALNESYSDIYGEVVDFINGAGLDSPGGPRTAGECSIYGGSDPPAFTVNSPSAIAGDYPVGGANFNPPPPQVVTADIAFVDDGDDEGGAGSTTDGCQTLVNAAEVNGKIALIDRGSCTFVTKVVNAQNAGAVGVVIVNNVGDSVIQMGGADPTITIPSVFLGQSNGETIKDELPGVNATIDLGGPGTDDSYRWLSGEDDTGFGGAIRDMWNPPCFGDPGKVSDLAQYYCATGDNGGVHTNSGVPNHAFALLVDGGTYNGQIINGIGLTKTFHIYWRAQSVYQTPSTDFPDHADALEASCTDLIGTDLLGLTTGLPSGEVIGTADCDEVSKAIQAVELRADPVQCGFEPLLNPNAPPTCVTPMAAFYSEDFAADPGATWTLTNTGVFTEYIPRDWQWLDTLPDGRTGGFYGEDDPALGNCTPGSDDQSGVMYLDSPTMTVPMGGPDDRLLLVFEHYVATEVNWDGGNVWISVNGGAWQLLAPDDFVFNAYNGTLNSAGAGNTNPLAGQPAFHGTNSGEVGGSWGESQVDVTAYAAPGDEIQLRFSSGTDGCAGVDGWYLDLVEVYSCVAPTAAINVAPTALSSRQNVDVQETQALTIDNNGDANLVWNVFDGLIFDQPNGGTNGIVSDYFADLVNGAYSADDFTLITDTIVTEIHASGFVDLASLASASAINLYIYPDSGGQPAGYPGDGGGTEVWSFTGAATTTGLDITGDDITLDLVAAGLPTPQLPAGTYWLVAYPSTTAGGFWWFWSRGVPQGSPAMLIDPGNVFGGGWTVWTDLAGIAGWNALEFTVRGYTADTADCTPPSDTSWLDVDPASGVVEYGAAGDVVDVIFDSTGLALGTYTGTLCVESNDPLNPLVQVPLELKVVVEPVWEKEIWINGQGFTPNDSPFTVNPDDTVIIVDRVWLTHTGNITFSLTEEWGDALDLQSYDAVALPGGTAILPDPGTVIFPTPGVMTWEITDGPSDWGYLITKTFTVQGGVWVTDLVTESLTVEGADPQLEDIVIEFNNAAPCFPVTGVDLTVLTSGDIYTDTVVQFSANVTPDTATPDYNYRITVDGGTPGATMTASTDPFTLTHTFGTTGTHTVLIQVWNCAMTVAEAVTDTVQVEVVEREYILYLPIIFKDY